MHIVDLPIEAIAAAEWNPNEMDADTRARLRRSIDRFGLVVPLVVRPAGQERYETIGGAQRLTVLQEAGASAAACVVVEADGTEAMLLSQALNHISGQDNPGPRAELLRRLLTTHSLEDLLGLLPETAESLKALSSLGQEDLAAHLEAWQKAQAARLRHLQFQLTDDQLGIVNEALSDFIPQARSSGGDSPNVRGTALFLLCQSFLDVKGGQS